MYWGKEKIKKKMLTFTRSEALLKMTIILNLCLEES